MSKPKWTPGPWEVVEREGPVQSAIGSALEPCWLFTINMPDPPFAFGSTGAAVACGYKLDGTINPSEAEVALANARLIAAAPNMADELEAGVLLLKAVKMALGSLAVSHPNSLASIQIVIDGHENALARARGEQVDSDEA